MFGSRATKSVVIVSLFVLVSASLFGLVGAEAPSNEHFQRSWQRTDKPVAEQQVSRTWMWGPEAFTPLIMEAYADTPGGTRQVQYFDKSRMEITSPEADASTVWYVTNGLLVNELMTGNLQQGHESFKQHDPAQVNVAGDADDPNGLTYASMATLRSAPAIPGGSVITQTVDRAGVVGNDPALAQHAATAAHRVQVPGIDHQVASPFWRFITSSGPVYDGGQLGEASLFLDPFFATGLPVTEAYWATIRVGGTAKDVLLQCFERRCLTYTPDNPEGWQVEAGNVGQHYYSWRYVEIPTADAEPTEPAPSPSVTATAEPPTATATTPPPTATAEPPAPTATATTPPSPSVTPQQAPDAVTSFTVTNTGIQLSTGWKVVLDWTHSGHNVDWFEVVREDASESEPPATPTTRMLNADDYSGGVVEGVPEGTWKYTVYAVNDAGRSAGASDTVTVASQQPPEPVGSFKAEDRDVSLSTGWQIALSWTHSGQNVESFYIVREDASFSEPPAPTQTYLLDAEDYPGGLSDGVNEGKWTYTIYAVNKAGHSSGVSATLIVDKSPPDPPHGYYPAGSVTNPSPVDCSNVSLAWNATFDLSGIDRYIWAVYRWNPETGEWEFFDSGSTKSLSAVPKCEGRPGAKRAYYSWYVRAFDNAGHYSEPSNVNYYYVD